MLNCKLIGWIVKNSIEINNSHKYNSSTIIFHFPHTSLSRTKRARCRVTKTIPRKFAQPNLLQIPRDPVTFQNMQKFAYELALDQNIATIKISDETRRHLFNFSIFDGAQFEDVIGSFRWGVCCHRQVTFSRRRLSLCTCPCVRVCVLQL